MDRWKPRNEAYPLSRDTVQVHRRRASANKQTILSSNIENKNNFDNVCESMNYRLINRERDRLFLNETEETFVIV